MKPVHIVHLSTYPPNDIRVFQKACKSEVMEGYQVTQIVGNHRSGTSDGVVTISVPTSKGRLSRMIGLPWKMYREAMRQRAEIFVIHHPDLIPAGMLLKLRGKKVIYDPREFYPDKMLSMRWIPRWLRKFASKMFAAYERVTSVIWDHIVTSDRYTANKAFTGRVVSVVPNYPLLNSVELVARNQSDKRTLLYVGGLGDERGLGVMLKIAELLRHRNVELQLMGPCWFSGDRERMQNSPNVKYLGNQSLEEVYRRMASADLGFLLLQPVPAYTYAGENTLKLFEYMWCSLPIVSSNFPNLKRIIETAQCGICIDPCNAENAAQAIANLLDHPETLQRMGENGRRAVQDAYNWPAAWGVLKQVYVNVLNGKRIAVEAPPLWNGEPADIVQVGTGSAA